MNATVNQMEGAMALTQKQAEQTDRIGMHRADHGLFLMVRAAGVGGNASSSHGDDAPRTRSWVFCFQHGGRRREMGLGALSAISLKQARALAAEQRELLRRGVDPIEERRRVKAAEMASDGDRVIVTFAAVAEAYLESRAPGWTGKHSFDWGASMARHVFPRLGGMAVRLISGDDVAAVLRPLWGRKIAMVLRQQIEATMEFAAAKGHRSEHERNPADRKLIKALLGVSGHEVEHHAALDYEAAPAFFAELMERNVVSTRALALVILTAVRTGDVLGMRWADVNFDTRTWTVPKTKTRKDFRVPLSAAAIKILRWQHERHDPQHGSDHVFPGNPGCAISTNTMRKMLRTMGASITVHGFRSSFRSWCESCTEYQDAVCEMALAHAIKGIKRPYQRDDLYAKRARLMSDWATFIMTPPGSKIIPLRA
jgi:integrase